MTEKKEKLSEQEIKELLEALDVKVDEDGKLKEKYKDLSKM